MDKRLLQLDEFIAKYPFWGEWEIFYTDGTHLREDEYVKLGDITIGTSKEMAQDYPILPFTFQPVPNQELECCLSELPEGKQEGNKAKRIILQQLANSLLRTGLLRPQFCLMEEHTTEMRFLEVMKRLSKHGHLIFVVDTSALRRAVTSFFTQNPVQRAYLDSCSRVCYD